MARSLGYASWKDRDADWKKKTIIGSLALPVLDALVSGGSITVGRAVGECLIGGVIGGASAIYKKHSDLFYNNNIYLTAKPFLTLRKEIGLPSTAVTRFLEQRDQQREQQEERDGLRRRHNRGSA